FINSFGIGATFNLLFINEVFDFKYLTGMSLLSIEEKYKFTTKKELGYSFLIEDELLYRLSKNFLLVTTVSFQPLLIHTDGGKRYYAKTIRTTGNIYSETIDYNIVERGGSFSLNFTALNFSIGLRYIFGKKEKSAGGGTE
ncbi:MAG: hypothetical protein J7L46_05390, partial [Bacteroidales bacterium]|nr:hypothetical protein [Bacteroidales bacterium]